MGILSWWRGKGSSPASDATTTKAKAEAAPANEPKAEASTESGGEAPGMNGAEEVRRPSEITVFEFGSAATAASTRDRVTLAGYCPVSEDLEPCRWQILPATGSDAPQFRVVF